VGSSSPAKTVTLRNTGTATDALGLTSIAASGDFHLEKSTCGTSQAAGGSCKINLIFRPTETGTRTGTLTIKDFNPNRPHTVSLSGTGS
jgi:hypothetical protein